MPGSTRLVDLIQNRLDSFLDERTRRARRGLPRPRRHRRRRARPAGRRQALPRAVLLLGLAVGRGARRRLRPRRGDAIAPTSTASSPSPRRSRSSTRQRSCTTTSWTTPTCAAASRACTGASRRCTASAAGSGSAGDYGDVGRAAARRPAARLERRTVRAGAGCRDRPGCRGGRPRRVRPDAHRGHARANTSTCSRSTPGAAAPRPSC